MTVKQSHILFRNIFKMLIFGAYSESVLIMLVRLDLSVIFVSWKMYNLLGDHIALFPFLKRVKMLKEKSTLQLSLLLSVSVMSSSTSIPFPFITKKKKNDIFEETS